MHRRIFCLIMLLIGTNLFAQTPTVPQNDTVDRVLLQWERAIQQVRFLRASCVRTDTDRVIGQIKVWEGTAAYQAPNQLRLRLENKATKDWEDYILTPKALYEYKSAAATMYVRQLPPPAPGQVANNTPMALLFGMKAATAKRRFDIKLEHQDQNYYYLAILPRDRQDKAEFAKARLVIYRANYLPREVRIETPNQNEVKWELPGLDLKTPVQPAWFTPYPAPQGWRQQVVPLPNAQPRR